MSFKPPTAGPGGQTSMRTGTSSSSQALPASGRNTGQPGQLPSPTFGSGSPSSMGSKVDCQEQQCAEEECDPEECGDENRPPRNDNYTCGVDRRPLLPIGLIISTTLGALCMVIKQRPLMRQLSGSTSLITFMLTVLYSMTLITMAYCTLSDPGQLQRQDQAREQLMQGDRRQDLKLPKRAHKAWLYALPIRRYDHYCKWLTNVIGLLNHREFILMCTGLVAIGVSGVGIDAVLLLAAASREHFSDVFVLLIHLVYSLGLTGLASPILRLHIGFVSRNELANDWKKNNFYVIHSHKTQKITAVNDLSDDEFNERFDSFCYDETRNEWDKGTADNCIAFWCTPRWTANQLGEF